MSKDSNRPAANLRNDLQSTTSLTKIGIATHRILEQRIAFDGAIVPAIVQAEMAVPQDAQASAPVDAADHPTTAAALDRGIVSSWPGRSDEQCQRHDRLHRQCRERPSRSGGCRAGWRRDRHAGPALRWLGPDCRASCGPHGCGRDPYCQPWRRRRADAWAMSTINTAALEAHVADLAIIKSAMSESGDILVYGCDVSAGNKGQVFVAALAQATGADVAASIDDTGSAARGGNWSSRNT